MRPAMQDAVRLEVALVHRHLGAEPVRPDLQDADPESRGQAAEADLLARIGLDTRKVAVERNLEIVPRSAYAATALAAGDRLEIVHFIGGG